MILTLQKQMALSFPHYIKYHAILSILDRYVSFTKWPILSMIYLVDIYGSNECS